MWGMYFAASGKYILPVEGSFCMNAHASSRTRAFFLSAGIFLIISQTADRVRKAAPSRALSSGMS